MKTPEEELLRTGARIVAVGTSENPDTFGLALLDQASHSGIPTLGLVDAFMNAEKRFSGRSVSPFAHPPREIVVPDTETKNCFAELGFPAENVHVLGHPHYDHVRSFKELAAVSFSEDWKAKHLPGSRGKKVIAFISEPAQGVFLTDAFNRKNSSYSIHGRGGSHLRTEIVMEELIDGVNGVGKDGWYTVLRLHPRSEKGEFSAYYGEFDHVSRNGDSLELLLAADAVAGITSMALIEAMLLEKDVLAILPHKGEASLLPCLKTGLAGVAWNREGVRMEIAKLLRSSGPRRDRAEALVAAFPARSLERLADLIEKRIK